MSTTSTVFVGATLFCYAGRRSQLLARSFDAFNHGLQARHLRVVWECVHSPCENSLGMHATAAERLLRVLRQRQGLDNFVTDECAYIAGLTRSTHHTRRTHTTPTPHTSHCTYHVQVRIEQVA